MNIFFWIELKLWRGCRNEASGKKWSGRQACFHLSSTEGYNVVCVCYLKRCHAVARTAISTYEAKWHLVMIIYPLKCKFSELPFWSLGSKMRICAISCSLLVFLERAGILHAQQTSGALFPHTLFGCLVLCFYFLIRITFFIFLSPWLEFYHFSFCNWKKNKLKELLYISDLNRLLVS